MSSAESSPWTQIIVGIAFLNAGLALLAFSIFPTIKDHWRMQPWPSTQATLTQVELDSYEDEDDDGSTSTTYRLLADYHYRVNHVKYTGQYFRASGGSDIQQLAQKLMQSKSTGQTIPIYYNPEHPSDSALFKDMPWDQIAMQGFFVLAFAGMGVVSAWGGYKELRKSAKH